MVIWDPRLPVPIEIFVLCHSLITMYPLEMWLQHQAYAHSGPQSQEIFSFIISGQIEWKKRPKKFLLTSSTTYAMQEPPLWGRSYISFKYFHPCFDYKDLYFQITGIQYYSVNKFHDYSVKFYIIINWYCETQLFVIFLGFFFFFNINIK